MPPPGLDRANTPGDDLHRVVARGWAALRDRLDAHDRHLPGFVSREVRAFVRCGDPAHGFAWLRCPEGHHHRLVPFSCKGRGFCPSCGGRRMATLAHRWTDELVPAGVTPCGSRHYHWSACSRLASPSSSLPCTQRCTQHQPPRAAQGR